MNKSKFLLNIIIIVGIALISGCAAQTCDPMADPPGFFYGLLHGFIIVFSFIAGWFTDTAIYAFPNTGFWYDLGFVIGVSLFFGGGGAGACKKK